MIEYKDELENIIERGEKTVNLLKKTGFPTLWRNKYSKAEYIGHNNDLLRKYDILVESLDIMEESKKFIRCYLSDPSSNFNIDNVIGDEFNGRDFVQLQLIAQSIINDCEKLDIKIPDGIKNVDDIISLILYHVCYETTKGRKAEIIVKNHYEKFGFKEDNKTGIEDGRWDSAGVDLLLYKDNQLFWMVQVKPISFLTGNYSDLIADRRKCFSQTKPFVKKYLLNHPNDVHEKMVKDVLYCFYDKESYKFVNFKGKDCDDGLFIKANDIMYEDGRVKFDIPTINSMAKVSLV